MLSKALVIISFVAAASAGFLDAPHIGAQSESTVRGFGGLSTVSQQSKAVDSPFSSVRKSDVRVTNDAVAYAAPAYAAAPVAYAQPAYAAAPVAYAQPAYAAAPVAYAQQAYAAPAVVAKTVAPVAYAQQAYAAPIAKAVAPVGYAAPAYAAAPVGYAAPAGLLGVRYSAVSPAVATLNFNGYGITYGY